MLMAGIAAMGLLAPLSPRVVDLWWLALLVLGFAVFMDGVRLWKTPLPEIKRLMMHAWSLGRSSEIRLRVINRADRALNFALYDFIPTGFEYTGLPVSGTLAPARELEVIYTLRPRVRGEYTFNGVDLRVSGPLGLVWRQVHVARQDTVRVFPDFKRLAGYAMTLGDSPLNWRGVRRRPKRGEGLEFQQLREYHPGDSLRQIDWKSTAWHRKIISREYQEERDQTVVILMDCGRRLRSEDVQGTLFDHALDSVLLLAYIALRQGDAVGFNAFNGDERAMAPAKGNQALHALLNQVYDLQPSRATFDFLAAAQRLLNRRTKRSLIIVVTRIGSEDGADLIAGARLLRTHHLVLLVTLREKAADALLDAPVTDLDTALRYGAAKLYHDARAEVLEQIRREGVQLLDTLPEDLPLALVNRYVEIKRAGLL